MEMTRRQKLINMQTHRAASDLHCTFLVKVITSSVRFLICGFIVIQYFLTDFKEKYFAVQERLKHELQTEDI